MNTKPSSIHWYHLNCCKPSEISVFNRIQMSHNVEANSISTGGGGCSMTGVQWWQVPLLPLTLYHLSTQVVSAWIKFHIYRIPRYCWSYKAFFKRIDQIYPLQYSLIMVTWLCIFTCYKPWLNINLMSTPNVNTLWLGRICKFNQVYKQTTHFYVSEDKYSWDSQPS